MITMISVLESALTVSPDGDAHRDHRPADGAGQGGLVSATARRRSARPAPCRCRPGREAICSGVSVSARPSRPSRAACARSAAAGVARDGRGQGRVGLEPNPRWRRWLGGGGARRSPVPPEPLPVPRRSRPVDVPVLGEAERLRQRGLVLGHRVWSLDTCCSSAETVCERRPHRWPDPCGVLVLALCSRSAPGPGRPPLSAGPCRASLVLVSVVWSWVMVAFGAGRRAGGRGGRRRGRGRRRLGRARRATTSSLALLVLDQLGLVGIRASTGRRTPSR